MITSMSDIICVTSRSLCSGDFLDQLRRIAKAEPRYVILREKDMKEEEYRELAVKAAEIFRGSETVLILHFFYKIAAEISCRAVHLPLHMLRALSDEEKNVFDLIGASCHSVEDAQEAENLGADYITAGLLLTAKKDFHRAELNSSAVCATV